MSNEDLVKKTIRMAIADIADAAFGGLSKSDKKFRSGLEKIVSDETQKAIESSKDTPWLNSGIDDSWVREAADEGLDHGRLGKAIDGLIASKDPELLVRMFDFAGQKVSDLPRMLMQKIDEAKDMDDLPELKSAYESAGGQAEPAVNAPPMEEKPAGGPPPLEGKKPEPGAPREPEGLEALEEAAGMPPAGGNESKEGVRIKPEPPAKRSPHGVGKVGEEAPNEFNTPSP